MPFQAFEFDESVAQTDLGRPHVPEGYYLLTKKKMEPTPEDYAKTTGVFTSFRFKEGPSHAPTAGQGRDIREYSSLGAGLKNGRGSQFGFGQLLGALGYAKVAKNLAGKKIGSYAEFESLIAAIDERIGEADVVALIADDTAPATGRPMSSLIEFLPASEWSNVKNSTLSPAVGPRVAQAANGTVAAPPAPSPAAVDKLRAEALAMFDE